MHDRIIRITDDFWNIRGSFRVAGLINVGTQASLVRRANGKFVFLDSYTLRGRVARQIDDLTNGGEDVEAILNLHPFHTVHVQAMHERYPNARLFGTTRHLSRFPDLPWQEKLTESPALHATYAKDFEFSVPRGVDFVSANENVHFSSVLAFHRASKTIHVDDTLMYVRLPLPMRLVGFADLLSFHPTLKQALEKRAGAAEDFRQWAEELANRWREAKHLCAAHTATLTAGDNQGDPIHARIRKALQRVFAALRAHERKFG